MFSATWPEGVKELANDFLGNYVQITIGSKGLLCANHNIKQIIDVCEEHEKEHKYAMFNSITYFCTSSSFSNINFIFVKF